MSIGVSTSRKPRCVQVLADRPHHVVAQRQVAAHRLLAQVEVAVAQAQLLAHRLVLVDLERRRLGVGQQVHRAHGQLDLAGGQRRVDRALLARHQLALGGDHVLGAQRLRGGVRLGRLLRAEHELEQPAAVAQVDEDEPAVVAPAVHPAGHPHALAHARAYGAPRPRRVR